jgi:hypothetical protein
MRQARNRLDRHILQYRNMQASRLPRASVATTARQPQASQQRPHGGTGQPRKRVISFSDAFDHLFAMVQKEAQENAWQQEMPRIRQQNECERQRYECIREKSPPLA